MNQLPEPWRPHMQKIAEVMSKVLCVRWDRCIPGNAVLRLYGWVDRPDQHSDFVLLDVERYSEGPWLDFSFATSSSVAEVNAELAAALGIPLEDHVPCQRVEEVFGGLVANAIKLDAPCDCQARINADRGDDWLTSGERQDGELVECRNCGSSWVHVCDEAEGCTWVPA